MNAGSRIVLAVAVLAAVAASAYWSGQRRGQAQAALVAAQARQDTVRIALTRAETVFVARVDTLRRIVARVDTVRDTLLRHITDTLLVKEYVAAVDTTLHACSDVLLSCDTVRARYAALVRADSATQRLLAQQQPTLWDKLRQRCGVSIGYGFVAGRPDVVAGCTIVP